MIHEPLLLGLFAVAFALALAWFACIRRLSTLLRERHAQKADDMAIEEIFPGDLASWIQGFDNTRPTMALLRFLWRRQYLRLRDDEVTRLAELMRWLGAVYLLLFIALAAAIVHNSMLELRSTGVESAAGDDAQLRYEANRLHRQGQYAGAIGIYDRLLGEQGNDAELVYARGHARRMANRFDEALVDYRRAMELSPGYREAYVGANFILLAQKRYADCLDLWNRYLRVVPGDMEAHYERSRAHFYLGDIAAAHADARRACELGKAEACAAAESLGRRL